MWKEFYICVLRLWLIRERICRLNECDKWGIWVGILNEFDCLEFY